MEPQELANDIPLPVIPSQHIFQLCPHAAVAWVSLQGWVVVARVVSKEEAGAFCVKSARGDSGSDHWINLEFVRDKVRNFCETRSVLVLSFRAIFFLVPLPHTAPCSAHRSGLHSKRRGVPHPRTSRRSVVLHSGLPPPHDRWRKSVCLTREREKFSSFY
jgi:hypothetical protein